MHDRRTRRLTRRWIRWIWIAYWAVEFTLTHVPKLGRIPTGVPHSDKVAHFGLYFGLAILGHYAARKDPPRSFGKTLAWSALYLAYGIFDEWSQQFVNRTPSIADWVADAAGVTAATLLILWKQHRDATGKSNS